MAIERIIPGTVEWEMYYANHRQRYQFACEFMKPFQNLNILDAACGVGYGTFDLAAQVAASKVIGIDRSDEALSIANKIFSGDKIRFLKDNCHTLAAASEFGPFDMVVSFETLEHLPEPEQFLKSCHCNLKPGGMLIISTPNKSVSSPDTLDWQYHEREYMAAELVAMLSKAGFNQTRLYGQKYSRYGELKRELRGEFNKICSNPFVRAGIWLQKKLRGHKPQPILVETTDDLEIVEFSDAASCDALGKTGPFVLLAVTYRGQ